ncbi:MAG: Fe-S cluster assembly protein SufD [Planctomycetota bacterium]|jgi:Fe-S cluster assembly protein SufD
MTTQPLDMLAIDGRTDRVEPEWLAALRASAEARFGEIGLPTPRDEAWRQTNLAPLSKLDLGVAPDARAAFTREIVDSLATPGMTGPQLVFVNGRYAPGISRLETLAGVRIVSLAEAVMDDDDELSGNLGQLARESEAFTALNTARFEDGVGVFVDAGASIESPIHVVFITSAATPCVTHPRLLVVAGPDSRVDVIEEFIGAGEDETYLTNALSEAVVAERADVRHYRIERESESAYAISTLAARQGDESRFTSHSLLLGGHLVRNNVEPVIDGENVYSMLNGLYVGRGRQHHDNVMLVSHKKPNCDSRQYYRGVLDDRSHGLFCGRIVVDQLAQKTDAVQSNANLLLSPDARAHAMPQLEIYADDVKCTHGATIGELDEGALFYLRSRGLSEDAAMAILVHAFIGESLDRIEIEALRDALRLRVVEHLPIDDSFANILE